MPVAQMRRWIDEASQCRESGGDGQSAMQHVLTLRAAFTQMSFDFGGLFRFNGAESV